MGIVVSRSLSLSVCAGPSVKSATGLMEWGDVDLALEAFVLGNHHTLFAKSGSQLHTARTYIPLSPFVPPLLSFRYLLMFLHLCGES